LHLIFVVITSLILWFESSRWQCRFEGRKLNHSRKWWSWCYRRSIQKVVCFMLKDAPLLYTKVILWRYVIQG